MKKPTHWILIESDHYFIRGKERLRWTSSVWSRSPKRNLWSSTKQLYSRAIDADQAARNFLKAAACGRVEVVREKVDES
jgi:hypothetical protein